MNTCLYLKMLLREKIWLPENYYLTHFSINHTATLINYENEIDLASEKKNILIKSENLKIWREENLTTRDKKSQENNVAILGWDYGEKNKNRFFGPLLHLLFGFH